MTDNVYEDEGIITDQEARNILRALAGTSSGLMMSLSLAVNTCYHMSKDDPVKAQELLKGLFEDYKRALDGMFTGEAHKKGVVIRVSDGSVVEGK